MLCPGLGLVERHVDGLVQAGAQAVDEPVRVALALRLLLGHRDEQVGEDAVEVEAAVLAIIIIITIIITIIIILIITHHLAGRCGAEHAQHRHLSDVIAAMVGDQRVEAVDRRSHVVVDHHQPDGDEGVRIVLLTLAHLQYT